MRIFNLKTPRGDGRPNYCINFPNLTEILDQIVHQIEKKIQFVCQRMNMNSIFKILYKDIVI
jgi:predicted transcriptional regulator